MEISTLWTNIFNDVLRGIEFAYDDQEEARKEAFVEVEIQFGTFQPPKDNQRFGKFRSSVSSTSFDRVMKYAKNFLEYSKMSEEVIEDQIDEDERKSFNKTTNQITYYDKIKIWSTYVFYDNRDKRMNTRLSNHGKYFAEELNSRINVSNEYIYGKPSRRFEPKTIRNKYRTSFLIPNIGKLDLTQASETSLDGQNQKRSYDTTYEIELELSRKDIMENALKIQQFSQNIYKLIQDSEIPYTNSDKTKMYKYVSDILHIDSGMLRYNILPEARDLKMEDMVEGGIVGNSTTKYAVTHKADGIRRWMIFTPNEVWLIMPGLPDANLLYRTDGHRTPYQPGYIFDGELLIKENRRDGYPSKYMYYIFDCVAENGNDIRRMKDYSKRIEYALTFTRNKIDSNVFNQVVQLRIKHSKLIPDAEHFFQVMTSMFQDQSMLNYNQDGFMFIPVNVEYNPYDAELQNAPPIYSRCLIQNSDICKWKPKEMRSIDFLVEIRQKTPDDKRIYLYALDVDPNTNERKMKVFIGSHTHPLNDRIDKYHPLLESLLDKSIVEFYWDEIKQLLVPIRIRSDKISPNRYFSALNIWEGIFSGIDPATLMGQSFQLMQSYHNQIKLQMFQGICKPRNNKVLLDIGSGEGDIVKKWSNFDIVEHFELVFAVEPNPSHVKELRQRLEHSPMKNKVVIIETGGEDYDTITKIIHQGYGERVSTVSLMLSFSFFHGALREGLRKTIEQNLEMGGEVLIFTIDGNSVKKTFSENASLKFLNAQTQYDSSQGKLYIDIPSNIGSQQEIPPKLDELFSEWNNFLPMEIQKAENQKFMNSEEKKFSEMFTSFKMKMLTDKRTEIEIERIVPYDTFDEKDWYGISIYPSENFFLSAILKAIEPQYQNNNHHSFRRMYENKVWGEIWNHLTEEERKKYPSLNNENILELFSDIFDISILYISENGYKRYGNSTNKIIINHQYLMAFISNVQKSCFLSTVF